ncbi:MAG: PEP/pyruvate-binding domain-containing protein, partial [Candidatus Heimdallarchaeota archaeon]
MAFLEHLLSITKFNDSYENIDIRIPISITICTDEFDNFLENNNLYEKLNPDLSDEEIVKFFTRSTLNKRLKSKLKAWLSNFKMPIAVRSSSLLEDSQFQPFAGVYKTFMLPNNPKHNEKVRLRQLCKAIKLVYASMFLSFPRHYLENVATHIEQEKMGVVIQEIIGQKHGIHYYPDISGVTQSYNYYPFGRMEPEDGIAYIALGLGKIIVDGQNSFQFCPSYPEIQPQMSDIHQFLNLSQNFFYSLNLDADLDLDYAEDTNLLKNDLSTAEEHGILFKIGSVYDVESDVIRDGLSWNGPRVITFASILKYKIFPLAKIIQDLLRLGEKAFGNPVEIEFAVNLKTQDKIASFYLLQIRP